MVTAAALLAGAATVAAAQSGSAVTAAAAQRGSAATVAAAKQGPPEPGSGIAVLGTIVSLPRGVWTDTPLEVTLPRAGAYELDADVRGRLAGNPAINTFMTARLWNVTAGAEVPQSERLVYQIIDLNPGTAQAGGNQTAPISELIKVTGRTTIRLQAEDNTTVGAATVAQVYSDGYGYTTLRYERVDG
jgi:hypothetical protein